MLKRIDANHFELPFTCGTTESYNISPTLNELSRALKQVFFEENDHVVIPDFQVTQRDGYLEIRLLGGSRIHAEKDIQQKCRLCNTLNYRYNLDDRRICPACLEEVRRKEEAGEIEVIPAKLAKTEKKGKKEKNEKQKKKAELTALVAAMSAEELKDFLSAALAGNKHEDVRPNKRDP